MKDSEKIAISVLVVVILIVGFIFFLDLYSKKIKEKTITEIQQQEYYENLEKEQIEKFKADQQLIFERNNFLKNLDLFLIVRPFSKPKFLFRNDYFIEVTNNSNYHIQKLILNLDYLSDNAIIKTEDVEFISIQSKDKIILKIPYYNCDSWKWRFLSIRCNELDLDFKNENIIN